MSIEKFGAVFEVLSALSANIPRDMSCSNARRKNINTEESETQNVVHSQAVIYLIYSSAFTNS